MEMQELETLTFKGAPMATKGNEVTLTRMPLNKIKLGRNSRANIDKDELEGLMESIKTIGLLQPIGVVKNGTGYSIAYGNRRFLACSKLGYSHIPAIIHTDKKATEIDIKNLAENVQRKNIGPVEIGRYVSLLKGEGMTVGEIAVRLGAARSYVQTCLDAFSNVPKEFRNDIVILNGNEKRRNGKISAAAAMKINHTVRTHRLSQEHKKLLYVAARADNFEPKLTGKYAIQLKGGNEDFLNTVEPVKHVRLDLMMTQKEFERLQSKHVDGGPFNSVSGFLKAVLQGKKSEHIKIIEEKQ